MKNIVTVQAFIQQNKNIIQF